MAHLGFGVSPSDDTVVKQAAESVRFATRVSPRQGIHLFVSLLFGPICL